MTGHYPVRRRGEKRRLEPNLEGIAWLEHETYGATLVVARKIFDGGGYWAQTILTADGAKENDHYPRPMFETISIEYGGSRFGGVKYASPCQACLDFSRSWNCPDHGEIPWNHKLKRWVRFGNTPAFEVPGADTFQGAFWAFRATLNHGTLEVSGETFQGVQSFHYELEFPDDRP